MDRFKDFLVKSLTTRVSPMVYIMMLVSAFIGFCFFTGFFIAPGESILFTSGTLIPADVWGALLFICSITCEIGFLKRKWGMVSVGSFGAWMLWLFATISLLLGGHIYAFVALGLFHLSFQGYVYLASSLGVLERQSMRL